LHISAPAALDGEIMQPYFAGTETAGRPAFGETDYPLHFGWAPLHSLRARGFKFIEAPRPELYNLHADPGELKNLYRSGRADPRARTMRAELAAKIPFISAAYASLPDPKDKIEQQNLFHTAVQAEEDNRPEQARKALNGVLRLDPKSGMALRQLGELELQDGQYRIAAGHLKKARELRPGDPAIAFEEAQALEKMGDLAKAREALEASLTLAPGQLSARLLLGRIYLELKNAEAAEDQFEAALLFQPNSVEAQVGLAKAQIAERKFADAIEQLGRLSKSKPGNAEVLELLAQAYSGMGKKQEAEQAGRKAKLLKKH
jgi:choline-sulfatase